MSNEELAAAIRAGERDKLMELWGQVRRLVHDMAYKRLRAQTGPGVSRWTTLYKRAFWASWRP
ncbi:MAG: hypothetical protein ACLUKH_06980 [Flavonifractor plautii]